MKMKNANAMLTLTLLGGFMFMFGAFGIIGNTLSIFVLLRKV